MNPFRRVGIFLGQTLQELQKTVWPTPSELRDSTIIVVIASILLGAFVTLADFSVIGWIRLLTNLVTQ